MSLHRRLVLTAAVLMPLGAVMAADPEWAASAGVDFWHYGALAQEIDQTRAEHDRLTAEDLEIRDRIALKEQLVAELIAGHTTLPEVTSQFTAINASRPEYMTVIRVNYPGDTDEEKVARNVIEYVIPRVESEPAERDRVLARLNRELVGMFPGTAPVAH